MIKILPKKLACICGNITNLADIVNNASSCDVTCIPRSVDVEIGKVGVVTDGERVVVKLNFIKSEYRIFARDWRESMSQYLESRGFDTWQISLSGRLKKAA